MKSLRRTLIPRITATIRKLPKKSIKAVLSMAAYSG